MHVQLKLLAIGLGKQPTLTGVPRPSKSTIAGRVKHKADLFFQLSWFQVLIARRKAKKRMDPLLEGPVFQKQWQKKPTEEGNENRCSLVFFTRSFLRRHFLTTRLSLLDVVRICSSARSLVLAVSAGGLSCFFRSDLP